MYDWRLTFVVYRGRGAGYWLTAFMNSVHEGGQGVRRLFEYF